MDATRSELEKELERVRRCMRHVCRKIEEHHCDIKQRAGYVDAHDLQVMVDQLKECEQELLQYRYVKRILDGILYKTQEPPAVEGE